MSLLVLFCLLLVQWIVQSESIITTSMPPAPLKTSCGDNTANHIYIEEGLKIAHLSYVNSEGLPEKYSCSVDDDELDGACSEYVNSLMEDGNSTVDIILSDNGTSFEANLSSSIFVKEDTPHMEVEFIKNYTLHDGVDAWCQLQSGNMTITSTPLTYAQKVFRKHPVYLDPEESTYFIGDLVKLTCRVKYEESLGWNVDRNERLLWYKQKKGDPLATSVVSWDNSDGNKCTVPLNDGGCGVANMTGPHPEGNYGQVLTINTTEMGGIYTFTCYVRSDHDDQDRAEAKVTIEARNRVGEYVGAALGGLTVLCIIAAVIVVLVKKRQERRRIMTNQRISARRELMMRSNNEYVEEHGAHPSSPLDAAMNSVAAILDRISTKYARWEIQRSSLMIKEQIGMGNFGAVYLGTMPDSTGIIRSVAVKTIKEHSCEVGPLLEFEKEMGIMGAMSHEHIVRFLGISSTALPVLIVMEVMGNGPLNTFVMKLGPTKDNPKGRLSVSQLAWLCAQPCEALDYLSEKGLVHRDVSARNCLVGEKLVVKLSDFGMSRDTAGQGKNYYKKEGGMVPIKWMAPEALTYGRYTTANDIWGFGVLFWEVFSFGAQPFVTLSNKELATKIHNGERLDKPTVCPEELWKWIFECWKDEPMERIVFSALCGFLSEFSRGHSKEYAQPTDLL